MTLNFTEFTLSIARTKIKSFETLEKQEWNGTVITDKNIVFKVIIKKVDNEFESPNIVISQMYIYKHKHRLVYFCRTYKNFAWLGMYDLTNFFYD